MYTTKAYLQKADKNNEGRIYIRYTYDRKTNAVPINEKIHITKFDNKKGFVKPECPEASRLNKIIRSRQQLLEDVASTLRRPEFQQVKEIYQEKLKAVEAEEKREVFVTKLDNIVNVIESNELPEMIQQQREVLEQLLEKQRELSSKGFRNVSSEELEFKNYLQEFLTVQKASSKTHVRTFIKRLTEFSEATNTPLTYDSFDSKFYESYASYLMNPQGYNFFNTHFGNHVNRLKIFLKWLEDEKGVSVNRGYRKYKILKDKKLIVYLSSEELELLWAYRDKVKPEYVKYIDLCVFGNLTGLRYSDIRNSYFRKEDGMLCGDTQKTSGDYYIPLDLDSRIEQILDTYKYNLRLVSLFNYNKYIMLILKDLFEHHNINQEKLQVVRYKLKDPVASHHYKYELLSSHSNRRGFCSRMHREHGYTERDILLMTGNKTSEVLRRYIQHDATDLKRKSSMNASERLNIATAAAL